MKSTIRKSTFMAMYRLLDRVSPVDFDCGKLCGCACCVPERSEYTDDLGIYLLPGEEKRFTGNEDWITWNYDYAEDYEFPDSWSGKVWFLSCNTPPVCDRKKRPLQCRTYPVAPHILQFDSDRKSDHASASSDTDLTHGNDEKLILILSDLAAPYSCPLIEAGENNSNYQDAGSMLILNEQFLKATFTVWSRLIKDPLIHDLVQMDSEDRDFFIPVYPYNSPDDIF